MKNKLFIIAVLFLITIASCTSPSTNEAQQRPMTTATSGVYTAVVQPGSGYQLIGDSIVVPSFKGTFVNVTFNIYLDGVLTSPQVVDVSVWSYDLVTEEYIGVVNGSGTGKYKQKLTTAGLVFGQPYRLVVSYGTNQNDQVQILAEPIIFQ